MSALVQLDRLHAEGEVAAAIDHEHVHAKNLGIKIDGGVDAGDSENKVVETFKGKGHESG
jgi:hypothetical protein